MCLPIDSIRKVNENELPYADFFSQHMSINIPVIIKLNISDWDCHKNWLTLDGQLNCDYLRQVIGNVTVPVAKCHERYFNSHTKVDMSLYDYLTYWETADGCDRPPEIAGNSSEPSNNNNKTGELLYLKDWHLKFVKPEYRFYETPIYFRSDFLNDYLIDHNKEDYKFVYMGKAGTFTPFHVDVFQSFSWSVNIIGRKFWYILPPGEEAKLKDNLGNLPFKIDDKLLAERGVKYYAAFQETCEAIFLPSGWHHQVHNVEDTISINHNWFNACNLQYVIGALQENERRVRQEISDCRDMDDFEEHCQVGLGRWTNHNFSLE